MPTYNGTTYTLRKAAEPRSHNIGTPQALATYELVIGGKVAALIQKVLTTTITHKQFTGWEFELEPDGENDYCGYETRDEAVKNALETLQKRGN